MFIASISFGQTFKKGNYNGDIQLNTITTAVPFLLISPDSRGGAMGDVGAASSPDMASMHYNAAKLAFMDKGKTAGLGISYSPWLRALVPDINLSYLSGYTRIGEDDKQVISGAMRYFSLGEITFTDETGTTIRQFKPNEFNFALGYSRKLSDVFSGAIGINYIYSNLTGGTRAQGQATQPGQSMAADLSFFYKGREIEINGKDAHITGGLSVTNIGAKMSYTEKNAADFLPTNLRLGTGFHVEADDHNQFSLMGDLNKLLVPTPVKIAENSAGDQVTFGKGDQNDGVVSAMLGSFTDAPGSVLIDDNNDPYVENGSVLKEELKEINYGVGMEYWYSSSPGEKLFAARAGFFHEDITKGNRQFITLGAGIKYSVFQLDFSYLVATRQQSPIANTLRFSLSFHFDDLRNKEE